jgi:hypothetical protein
VTEKQFTDGLLFVVGLHIGAIIWWANFFKETQKDAWRLLR